jgi:hypothetical protein
MNTRLRTRKIQNRWWTFWSGESKRKRELSFVGPSARKSGRRKDCFLLGNGISAIKKAQYQRMILRE